jgi:expansin (peptidoglycan-binding protein)
MTHNGTILVCKFQKTHTNSAHCGECVQVTGPKGNVLIKIVDKCPECKTGDLDFSPVAFDKFADRIQGRVPISWYPVPCPVTGGIVYHFKDGINPWFDGYGELCL